MKYLMIFVIAELVFIGVIFFTTHHKVKKNTREELANSQIFDKAVILTVAWPFCYGLWYIGKAFSSTFFYVLTVLFICFFAALLVYDCRKVNDIHTEHIAKAMKKKRG